MKDRSTDETLTAQGYRLVDDAWETEGRRTYLHEEDATCGYLMNLAGTLRRAGWETDKDKLRSFRRPGADDIIEVEPGGSETTGHFLHHMLSSVEANSG